MIRPAEKIDRYLPQLDGVRAIAVLLVVVQHWIANPFNLGAPFGFIGVTMFFVLSGYLISRILFQAKERLDRGQAALGAALRIFYIRRFLRIFPIYYLTIFVLWALGDPEFRESIGWLTTYTINFYFLKGGDRLSTGHLWTLAIEEQYYIVYPLIVLLCTPRQRLRALIGMCAVAFVSRIALDMYGVSVPHNKYFTLCCFDSFAMGGMLAHWELSRGKESVQAFFRKPRTGAVVALIVIGFGALGALLGDKASLRVVWFRTVISIASLYVVGLALLETRTLGRVLGNRTLVFLGKISYGLYLYHPYSHRILGFFFAYAKAFSFPVQVASFAAITMIVASASWFFFEKPINAQKSRFSY
jgi:peptidoglycan/LPS O-acetylase OafA/YrhL